MSILVEGEDLEEKDRVVGADCEFGVVRGHGVFEDEFEGAT
jgi:hypothetical protein